MVDVAAFGKLDAEIAIQVLARLLERLGGGAAPRLAAVEALHHWLQGGESRARTLAGCRIARRTRHLLIGREPGRISPAPVAIAAGQSVLWDNRFTVALAGTDRACTIVPVKALKLARRPEMPAFVQESLPAIMAEGEIVAIPAPWSCRKRGDTQHAGPRRFSENWPLTCSRNAVTLGNPDRHPYVRINFWAAELSPIRTCAPLREEQRE